MNRKALLIVSVLVSGLAIIWALQRALKRPESFSETPPPEQVTKLPVTFSASPTTRPSVAAHSLDTERKLQILDEVFSTKNDNDPRLDREFKGMSAELKAALEEKYRRIPPENRNERGTIVFLIGRDLASSTDLDFLNDVLSEKQCLSMTDCSQAPAQPDDEHAHLESGMDVTLSYPQIVALKSLPSVFVKENLRELTPQASKMLEQATHSKNPLLARMAESLSSERPQ